MNTLLWSAILLIIMTALGLLGLRTRIRAQRWKAVLDAYADREIARAIALNKRY